MAVGQVAYCFQFKNAATPATTSIGRQLTKVPECHPDLNLFQYLV
jgi:hypothetical protein